MHDDRSTVAPFPFRDAQSRGALGASPLDTLANFSPAVSSTIYVATTVGTGAFGGVLTGLVASSDWRGAVTGGLFGAGTASLIDAFVLSRDENTKKLAGVVGVIGAVSFAVSIFLSLKRKR